LDSFLREPREDPIVMSREDAKMWVCSKVVRLLKRKVFMGDAEVNFSHSAVESGIRTSRDAACS